MVDCEYTGNFQRVKPDNYGGPAAEEGEAAGGQVTPTQVHGAGRCRGIPALPGGATPCRHGGLQRSHAPLQTGVQDQSGALEDLRARLSRTCSCDEEKQRSDL